MYLLIHDVLSTWDVCKVCNILCDLTTWCFLCYHAEGPQRADEGLVEAPGLWTGILPGLQHRKHALEAHVTVHQPPGGWVRENIQF